MTPPRGTPHTPGPHPIGRGNRSLASILTHAAGMTDDTAHAWLDHQLPRWRQTWTRRGHTVLTELHANGHDHLADRLLQLLGPTNQAPR